MKTFKNNYLSLVIIIVAILIGFFLQHKFNLPLFAGAFIGVFLGMLGGFITQILMPKDQNHDADQKHRH
ncbi:hypothetical protein [Staphylococcus coagulans]|uniref:hypothetical protein n=1 Tax=Staphylococcus coagulans TaxID=74706 RepID=UPI003365164B